MAVGHGNKNMNHLQCHIQYTMTEAEKQYEN